MLIRFLKNSKSFFFKTNSISKIEKKIDYSFQNKKILKQAFTHKSINKKKQDFEKFQIYSLKHNTALCPPNPKVLDKAHSNLRFCEWFGT